MPSAAVRSHGIAVKIDDGVGNFTLIAELRDITGPGFDETILDITNHSTSAGYKEKLPGVQDSGQLTFDVNWVVQDPTHRYSTGLLRDKFNRTKRNFQIIWTDTGATLWAFAAYVKAFQPTGAVDGILTARVTLEITGQFTTLA
jgi:predicted secreted protein